MTRVDYELSVPYRNVPGMPGSYPATEVKLFNGEREANAVGILDSGATVTAFSNEYAELLGIEDVREGTPVVVSTLGGPIELYMFDLEMQITSFTSRFGAQIAFFGGRAPRNILGRGVVFSKFQLGFCEAAQVLHFKLE